ncbi:hypothetical protein MCAP1_001840 [Malassezia caprae]|uniref:Uncharacterized protein n=1 Tax=Malassezia caprae TaxID=1381934 RepID=A0AAF0EAB0_9BASI|nr:hypothetical protein MCAP1_001840 [Malassezia caprae]
MDGAPQADLRRERAQAVRAAWAQDLHTLCRTRSGADAVWRTDGSGACAAHTTLVGVRARGAVRAALLGHKRLFRSAYHVALPLPVLESVLAWAYTGAVPDVPALARALGCSEVDARACVAAEPAHDWCAYVAAHPRGAPRDAWHAALVSVRWPAMRTAPWRALPRAAQRHVVSLLYAGCLASTPCAVHELLACADVLHAHAWPQAAQLLSAAAWAQAAPSEARSVMTHAVACDDAALQAAVLAWMCSSEAGAAVLPAVPRALHGALGAQLLTAPPSTRLAFIEALYTSGVPSALHPMVAASFAAMLGTPRGQALLACSSPVVDVLVSILLTTLHAESAPALYAVLVGDVMLADEQPLAPGRAWDVLEQARRTVVQYLRHHWVAARAARAFDALPAWCLKELAAELDLEAQALRVAPAQAPAPASDASSVRGMTSAGLAQTRAPEQRGPASLYAAVLNKSAARAGA